MKKIIKQMKHAWAGYLFKRKNPIIAERRALLAYAIKQGKQNDG